MNTNGLNDQSLQEIVRDKELLQQSQRIGKLGGWELDLESQKLYWTAETYRLHDTSPEEFDPTVDAGVSYFLPKSQEIISKALDEAINFGKGYDLHLETLTTKGRHIYVRTTCEVTTDQTGKPIKLTGIFQDVSEYKRLESITNSYKFALESHSLVSITTVSGEIIYANDKFCEVSGFSRKELLGQTHSIINSGYHPKSFFDEMYRDIFDGKVWHNEIQNKKKSGEIYWVDSTIVPRFDESNKLIEFIAIRTDITERKVAQQTLIQNQRLSAMGEMASSVAHDFNNSLQAIVVNLEVARNQLSNPELLFKTLNTVDTIVKDVSDRVGVLQKFGNPQKARSNSQSINPNELIQEAITELRPIWKDQLEKLGISINFDLNLNAHQNVRISRGDFKTVIYNLIKNSLEAARKDLFIKIGTEDLQGQVRICVADNGTGMTEEQQQKAFQPFFSTKGFDVGRGLGLTGVRTIVSEQGGSIEVVNSQVGKGTEFCLVLPAKTEFIENAKNQDDSSVRIEHVLWVEDDASIGENAKFLLDNLGYRCTWVQSAEEALKRLTSDAFDLMITDVGMPGMSGTELSTKVSLQYPSMPIAIVSGWEFTQEDLKKCGAFVSITKPFTLDRIKTLLTTLT